VQELSGTTPTANLLTGGADEYFTRTDSSWTANFLTDALGSTVGLADSSGTVQTAYSYEPFGNTTVSGSSTTPYQYTGRENDGTGLYFNRARYYSPTLQRFVSEDSIDFKGGGANFYAYVLNNPMLYRDPSGQGPANGPWSWPFGTTGFGWWVNQQIQHSQTQNDATIFRITSDSSFDPFGLAGGESQVLQLAQINQLARENLIIDVALQGGNLASALDQIPDLAKLAPGMTQDELQYLLQSQIQTNNQAIDKLIGQTAAVLAGRKR
jgi:RHS repeat-associated protein